MGEAGREGLRTSRRGYVGSDARDFSPAALEVLARAAEELSYLLDRDYPRDPATTFVGDRYQLTRRQRLLLARAVSGEVARKRRERTRRDLPGLAGAVALIDGFNTIITLEVALSGSPVVLAQDGTARDLAGLRGTYRPIDKTPRAVGLIFDALERYGATGARFLFDAPVSNSGVMCALVGNLAQQRSLQVSAEATGNVDALLSEGDAVVSSDSVVIDACAGWYNLAADIVCGLAQERPGDFWLIDLFGSAGTDARGSQRHEGRG